MLLNCDVPFVSMMSSNHGKFAWGAFYFVTDITVVGLVSSKRHLIGIAVIDS